MKKFICMILLFGTVFLTGCEKRVDEGESEKSQENSSETSTTEPAEETVEDSEVKTQSVNYDDGRPHEEQSVYSFLAVYEKYFPGKTKNTFDAFSQANTPSVMYAAQSDFLNLWEYWVEQKHNPDSNARDGVMKISGKMYEEHENKIREIIDASKEIKNQWDDIDKEIMKACQAQKISVSCE